MIRSFVGLPIAPPALVALQALQQGLPMARPVPAENMHLTLAFLDDQPEAVLRALSEDLCSLTAVPFEVRLSGLTVLGGKQPGAIAVPADGGDALTNLQARVARIVRQSGIDLERRRFRPHVTIFRLSKRTEATESKRIQDWIADAAAFDAITFSVGGIGLYRSVLRRSGAVYDLLADYPFLTE